MNTKYMTSIGLCLLMLTSSCNDLLEQTDPNAVTVDDYFKTENDVQLAVNGIYQSLRSSDAVGENSGLYTDERSDDTGTNDNQSNSGEPFQFNNFALLASNTWLKNHWVALYQSITRCNVVLSNMTRSLLRTQTRKRNSLPRPSLYVPLFIFNWSESGEMCPW